MLEIRQQIQRTDNMLGRILQSINNLTNPRERPKGHFERSTTVALHILREIGRPIPKRREVRGPTGRRILVEEDLNEAYVDMLTRKTMLTTQLGNAQRKQRLERRRQLRRSRLNPLNLVELQCRTGHANATSITYSLEGIPTEFVKSKTLDPYDKNDANAVTYYNLKNSSFRKLITTVLPTEGLGRVNLELVTRHCDEFYETSSHISTKLVPFKRLQEKVDDLFKGDFYKFTSMNMKITITKVVPLEGGGSTSLEPYLVGRKGYYRIENDDDICGQRCLALASMSKKQFSNYRQGQIKIDRHLKWVTKILGETRLSFTAFEQYRDAQVFIIDNTANVLYKTKNAETERRVYLYYDFTNEHYHLITNIHTFTAPVGGADNYRWCEKCNTRVLWKYLRGHKCVEHSCKACKQVFASEQDLLRHMTKERVENKGLCEQDGGFKRCPSCNMGCHGDTCLAHHIKDVCPNKTTVVANHRWKCPCGSWHDKDKPHVCGEVSCGNCGETFPDKKALEGHRCYIQKPLDKDSWCKPVKWMVYDFESAIDPITHVHEVNMCKVADSAGNIVFTATTLQETVDWMLSQKRITFIAHNGKAYDTWLIHSYLITKTGERPSGLILAGQKIMQMKIKSLTFIDSLNHIADSLERLPKTLGFSDEGLKKGFFPYAFNTKANEHYVGPIPGKEHFAMDRMTSEKREEFIKWHAELTSDGYVWDHQKELSEYCESDVIILSRAMQAYQSNGIALNNLDPLQCVTIASYCMRVFKVNHLGENTISVLKRDEYDFCKRAFFGGRTNCVKLYKDWTQTRDKGVYGRYIDVQSLYPTVQFFDELPVGAPRWIEAPTGVNEIGYYEVDISPPNDLYHPVLPEKKNGKLIFDLLNKEKAVYSSIELTKAISKGYIVTKYHRALVWDNSSADVFKSYVRQNLKMKVEATGFNGTEEELRTFIKEHKKRFDIDINPKHLKKNPGMRALAKIQLNSLWGKFGQKVDLSTTKYVTDPSVWHRLVNRHTKGNVTIVNEKIIDNECIFVEYVENDEAKTSLTSTNLGLAAFVTAHARMRLYRELELLDRRVCYFDTDSIIYERDPEGYNTPEGDYLGEWESETGSKAISSFVSIGPKSYSYKVEGEAKDTKFKGFTLNYENARLIHFESLKSLVDNNEAVIRTSNLDFIKNQKTGTIQTIIRPKEAAFVYDKRVIVADYDTRPYGHIDLEK